MVLGDGQLLLTDIAGQTDDIHAVEQWSRDAVQRVGGADKQDVRQIQTQIQVMVEELAVLLGVKRLQQR